jgi:hypothetical protein
VGYSFDAEDMVAVSSSPCVLVVADPGRVAELTDALFDPLPHGAVDVVVSSGGDDTIELFEARRPRVVVLTASLEVGDAKSLIEALRDIVPRDQISIVLVGDDETGPIRNALDAIDYKPDRFVARPLSVKALRFAVGGGLAGVARALGELVAETAGSDASNEEPSGAGEVSTQPGGAGEVSAQPSGAGEAPTPESSSTDDAAHVIGSRTSTPLRGSGPMRSLKPTEPLDLHGVSEMSTHVTPAPDPSAPPFTAVSTKPGGSGSIRLPADEPTPPPPIRPEGRPPRAITATRGSAYDEPAVPRSLTPQRGSGNLVIGDGAPFGPVGTLPRFSGLVEAGDVPPVLARANTLSVPGTGEAESPAVARAPTDRGTGITPHPDDPTPAPIVPRAPTDRGTGITMASPGELDPQATRAALRARWEALADSIYDDEDDLDEETEEPAAPLPPVDVGPRSKGRTNPDFMPLPPVAPWRPGTTSELREEDLMPAREPTLILNDNVPIQQRVTPPPDAAPAIPVGESPDSAMQDRTARERWSNPVLLSELIDRSRDSSRELLANVGVGDDLAGLDDLDDDDSVIVGHRGHTPLPHSLRGGHLEALEELVEPEPPPEPPTRPSDEKLGSRDFARQLRAKMSMMAQRLFQSGDSQDSQPSVDVRPRHDHHTEIDLAALGEEQPLGGVTEIGRVTPSDPVQITTSPGTWDTQVRERGLPDSGEIVRGVSDAAVILARMFAASFTGRVGFRRDDVEKVVFLDQGRPVFASSNEPGDRMGELLVREGKITASQYERCQVVVAQSGRRMGEILVDFGYLKRRELLPAVRRHVEDILYSLFGWDRGHYHMTSDTTASSERIRLSRHPASLVLEGIRRKLDRTTLEKLLGPPSTVIEVADRERLGGVLNTSDLAIEERTALAAFDGQADLAQVARTTGVDIADVLPLAWGLCVLGLANARRAETEVEESTALVGETDLAIDRERVRARWQLVTEADYFALLGVRRDATGFEIRRAYQSARRDFAPDGFPGDLRRELARELEEIGTVLDEAFRVLRDDRLRQTYLANLIE